MTPFFSVIVPVYNVEPYLRRCVDSILGQTFADFELILVDDGSPDGCPAVCDEYAAGDPRVSVIHRENGGLAQARLSGLKQAGADYVSFIDSDDYVSADYLALLHDIIIENDRPDLILHGLTRVYTNRTVDYPPIPEPGLYDKARLEAEIYPSMLADLRGANRGDQLIPGYVWAKPGRRELYLAHYLSDERIRHMEDISMMYELMVYAGRIYITRECPYYYLIRGDSIMSSYKADFFRTLKLLYDYVDGHLVPAYPPAKAQLQAYVGLSALNTVWDEFRHAHPFGQALRHVREELDATALLADTDVTLFRGLKRIYLRLLKKRMYFPVVAAAYLQSKLMPGSAELRYDQETL